MCGIVGARHDWLLQQGLDPETAMRAAVASLAWRGPDGQHVVRAGEWWLGCARLAIGPKNSRQPVVRRGGRFVGVMNGAITNARELWAELVPGVEKRAALPNDAWLPLLAVERGDTALSYRFHGHGAWAVADATTGELVLGRDWFGEKPFFALIGCRGDEQRLLAFASAPPALRALGMPLASEPAGFSEWFRFGWRQVARELQPLSADLALATFSEPWPSCATVGRGSWSRSCDKLTPKQYEAARTRPSRGVRADLVASVRRCTDTRVPVALALSGGLDSSCLAVALAAAERRVPAYQLQADGTADTERRAATAVAARMQLELRRVDVGTEVCDALSFLTACAGEPLGDPSILAVHALARAAAADTVRVLLGGEGADEIHLGYRRYRALAQLPRARWLRPLAPRWSMRYAARWFRAVTAQNPVDALLAVTPPAFAAQVLAPALAADPCWHDERAPVIPGDDLVDASARDFFGYLPYDLLPKVDIACMAAGIESRCPYLEAWTPPSRRDLAKRPLREQLGKRRLREAFANELPPEVLRLPKTGFALPLDRWFRGELPWLDLLAEPRTRQRPHLRPGGVARAVDLHRAGKVDLGHGLYLLVAAEIWLRQQEGNTDSVPPTPGAGP